LVQIVVSTRFNQRRSSADPVVCYAPTGGAMTHVSVSLGQVKHAPGLDGSVLGGWDVTSG
jgi:hypothetical protein